MDESGSHVSRPQPGGGDRYAEEGKEGKEGQGRVQPQGTASAEGVASGLTAAESALLGDLATLRGRLRVALGSSAAYSDDLTDVNKIFRDLERMILSLPGRRAVRREGQRTRIIQGHL